MEKRRKTSGVTRLLWPLVLGLGLTVGLLLVLVPYQQAQAQAEPEVGIWKWNMGGYARPGGVYVYGIYYGNDPNATATATDTIIVDILPVSTTYAGDTSGITPDIGAGGVITWDLGDLAPGDEGVFMVTLNVSSTVPTGSGVITRNCALITTTTPGDTDLGNNYQCADPVDVWDDDVEVSVDKWANPNDPTPGQEFLYTIDWCNRRGAAAGPVWLTDTLPLSTTFVRWSPQQWWQVLWTEVITTGGQFVLYAPGLPGDWCRHLYLRLLLDADAPLSTTLENTVVITTAGDVDPMNNQRTHADAHVRSPRYGMGMDKQVNEGALAPGGWVEYHIDYYNQGNSAVHAWLTDTLPEGTYYLPGNAWQGGDPFTPTVTTGDYLMWDLDVVDVNWGDSLDVRLEISGTVSAPTVITNCAAVGIAETEETPWDNTGCITVTVFNPGPNLHVEKRSEWHGDGEIGYEIHFANYGDQPVSNVHLTDTFPISTTSYPWEQQPAVDYQRAVTVTSNYTDNQWLFLIEELGPGDSGRIDFNVTLDDPGALLRWYTNIVEIDTPPNDANPADNTDTDVAFSGGEVDWVDLDVGENRIWLCTPNAPITITTAYTQVVFPWNNCIDERFDDPFQPGDVVTVAAGAGIYPVVIQVPDPFTAQVDSVTDMVWGQIDALDREWVTVDLYGGPRQDVRTDGRGNYSATFPDVPRGGEGEVRYRTEIDYAEVTFHRRFQTQDLIMRVNYDHDWVEGNYEAGHTIWITATESDGSTIKATAELTTGVVPWWSGQTGFSTNWQGWTPEQPDIASGDWVYGLVDNGYTSTVRVGTINGELDIDADTVSGTIHANWFTQMLNARCWVWESGGPAYDFTVDPDGGTYFCDFSSQWDLLPGQDVGVQYQEPDGDQVINVFEEPVPRLRVEKRADGDPGEGGNFVFRVQYRNEGGADAENTVITDTLLGGMTYLTDTSGFPHTGSGTPADPIVWDLGTVEPGDWIEFDVFVQVTAVESETITNTVQIATSNPYDEGDPGEKESSWWGHVRGNDTRLNVGKWAWTGDPAPGTDFVYAVNVCNNGNTGSSQVTLTDTLHPSTTLQSWWGEHPGWTEVISSSDMLVVSRPSIPGRRCREVYLRVHLADTAWSGMSISNTAVISASNDIGDDNETTWWGQVSDPHTNLYINKRWSSGRLVPGGEIRYWIDYDNNGNVPVTTAIRITDTLPVSTTFAESWLHRRFYPSVLITPTLGPDYVVWDVGTLDNGYSGNIEVVLDVDNDAVPGTVLTNSVEISPQPGEDSYDDNVATVVETLYDHGLNLRVRKEGGWDDWGDNTRRASYELTVENIGDVRMDYVTVTDTYPASMYLDGGVGANFWRWWDWRDYPGGHYFTVTFEALYPGDNVRVNFGAITDTEPLPFGLLFTNTAEVTLDPADVNPADNTDEVVLTTGPDLYVEKTLAAGDPLPGELITFSLTFGNDHEGHEWWWDTQGDVQLTDILPDGLAYVSADPPYDLQVGSQLFWFVGQMGAGHKDNIYLTARITDTAEGDDIFTNRAEIASDQPNIDVEPYYGNNQDRYDVVIALPKFEVGKVYESSRVAGTPVTYTLTVTNVGSETATGVIVSDTVPAHLTEVVARDGTLESGFLWWQLGPIAPDGGTATAMFYATLPCTAGLSIVNDDYGVRGSDQGVSGPAGAAVSFSVLAPTLSPAFTQSATDIDIGATVTFTDTSTTDGTDIVAWAWDFGDAETGSGATTSHTYDAPGAYTVTLTITDACGFSASAAVPNAVTIAQFRIFLPAVMRNY